MGWLDWFVFGFIGGLWAQQRQWLRQKEANKDRKPIHEFNQTERERERSVVGRLLMNEQINLLMKWMESTKRKQQHKWSPKQLTLRGKWMESN